MPYVPERGDLIWMDFDPQAGHEQAGRRPACVLSPADYNRKVGLALVCPVTSKIKGYSFEVLIPTGLKIQGVILADQVRSVDWHERDADFRGIEMLWQAHYRDDCARKDSVLRRR